MAEDTFAQARSRVLEMFPHECLRHTDIVRVCMYDWPNLWEHLEWLLTAPRDEIERWAQAIIADEDAAWCAAQDEPGQ